MRYGSGHKAESKSRILEAAARQLRAKGPNRVSVAEIMSNAGLTHGAFYAHFDSKNALVAEAVSEMFTDAGDRAVGLSDWPAYEGEELRAALRTFLKAYLSASHRDKPEGGCPLPALAAEISRADVRTRNNFTIGLNRMTARIENALSRLARTEADADARAVVAQMVGAVSLARAIGPGAHSDAILRDCLNAIIEKLAL